MATGGVLSWLMPPLVLNAETFFKVITAVNSTIEESTSLFAVRAHATNATLFLSGRDLFAYLKRLETKDTVLKIIDFEALKTEAPALAAATPAKKEKEDAKIEGSVQIAVGVKKEVDFATWYTSVLTKADMIDYYSVSGCYILKPWSYSIWEIIQDWFNSKIKEMGVQNAYSPCLFRKKVLEREKDHIEGFSPEGVPLRLKIGPADIAKQQTLSVHRDTGVKSPLPLADITKSVPALLETIQEDMFKRAQDTYNSRLKEITNWDDVVPALDNKRAVVLPWWEEEACEDDIVADRKYFV
ncbi:hypothetical protein EW026_g4860 [Hermanssonia centrifuga]|uniref:Prolyl-tRNA synthetase n=1 Tax=Hermanssonia centrifuga TaxID=98765 RepID=A0A4S4KGI0_9APHY|nr:hypothetical protein EW026_g4860 [Hermanssonia centrifuga]